MILLAHHMSSTSVRSPVKAAGFTPRFAQLDKKVLRYFGVFEELLDPAIVGSAPAGKS